MRALNVVAVVPLVWVGAVLGVVFGIIVSMTITSNIYGRNALDTGADLMPHTKVILPLSMIAGGAWGAKTAFSF
jgi:hypothetical protein